MQIPGDKIFVSPLARIGDSLLCLSRLTHPILINRSEESGEGGLRI